LALHAALHLLGKVARRLLQLVERLGLWADRLAGLAALQGLGSVAHRPLGTAQRLGDVTETVAEPAHHVAEHAAQPFLLSGGIAQLAVGVRLVAPSLLLSGLLSGLLSRLLAGLLTSLPHAALLTLLALLLLGAEAAVEQLLLTLHQLAHVAHHLLRLARPLLRHLPGFRHPQVFEHVL
jgi:hypothetical protein